VVQQKFGLLGGVNWGRGCIFARLADGSWSPPCFLRLRHASLGLTFGMRRISSCYVLQSQEQVDAFARSKSDCGFDAAVSQDADPFDRDAPEGGVTLLR
jgi:lipid-binding SYLF domain-containing protein